MGLSATEHAFVREFERRQAIDIASCQDRVRKKPIIETLSNPSSLVRAALILPMPWVCLYTTIQLSQHDDNLLPAGFVVAFLLGYFVADLMTGLIHLRFDTVPLRMNPDRTLMEFIAWGFQRHHAVQQNWLYDDIFESGILTSGFLTFPFYLLYLTLYAGGMITSAYVAFSWTIYLTATMHVQLFHAAAHNTFKSYPPQVQAILHQLVSWGLILDAKDHHLHHTRFDCNFSLINGWSNCLVNPLYRYLERNGYIDPAMHGSVQRKIYIQEKAQLSLPYCRMFPEYRVYQERMRQEDDPSEPAYPVAEWIHK